MSQQSIDKALRSGLAHVFCISAYFIFSPVSVPQLFRIDEYLSRQGVPSALARPLAALLGRLLRTDELNACYSSFVGTLSDRDHDPAFFMKALRAVSCQFEVDIESFERIPREGPLIVVANHPRGALDGLLLGALLQGRRPDLKLLGNHLLMHLDGIRGSIIPVDPFGGVGSKQSNLRGMREVFRHLKAGGCLGTFPSGEVSSFHWRERAVIDPAWSPHVVQLALKSGASILPLYFEGRNSLLFQILGLLHPRLRTFLLARELCRGYGEIVPVRVGRVITPDRLQRFEKETAAIDYLRLKSYALREQKSRSERLRLPFRSTAAGRAKQPLAAPQPVESLVQELASLPERQRLVEHSEFDVYYAKAKQIPVALQEIGRLREEAFRAVDEGTGEAVDLDAYDEYYVHLFLWHRENRQIAGAYRIGLADEIVEKRGLAGLYTSTLFKYKQEFLDKVGPSLELGRSFVRLEYQRKPAALHLIWRGIGEFIARNPRYRILFGPVSITNAYHNISKNLMVHFFREHSFDEDMSQMVKARNPPKEKKRLRGSSLKNIAESIVSVDSVSAIVSGFENDQKGIPILLRHYLKLNGVLVSFNVDPAFSDVIDGLILVDVCKASPKLLERYFGKEAYQAIAEHHANVMKEHKS